MTTTRPSADLVFNETSTYIATPCPDYCDLPLMHPVDNVGGEKGDFRGHGGPEFGQHLTGYAEEYTHSPGVLVVGVEVHTDGYRTLTVEQLRQLAVDAEAAAQWLEAQA